MRSRAERQADEQPSTSPPQDREELNEEPPEVLMLGVGSHSPFVEEGHQPSRLGGLRGLLPVPPEVEEEIKRQETKHPMTPQYRKTLRDRLTVEHFFAGVEVAFRRTESGIEVLAAGLDQIAEFRMASTREQRQGVVYGVG